MNVINNVDFQRYEVQVEGKTAYAAYQLRDTTLILDHTEVPTALGGRGIGGHLAKAALEDARTRGLRVDPRCSFIAAYIKKHPEYDELVTR